MHGMDSDRQDDADQQMRKVVEEVVQRTAGKLLKELHETNQHLDSINKTLSLREPVPYQHDDVNQSQERKEITRALHTIGTHLSSLSQQFDTKQTKTRLRLKGSYEEMGRETWKKAHPIKACFRTLFCCLERPITYEKYPLACWGSL